MTGAMVSGLGEAWLSDVIATLERRFGLVPSAQQREPLARAVSEAIARRGLETPRAYCELLSTLPLEHELVQHLMHAVTINESYFFRDRNTVQTLRDEVLPKLIERVSASRVLRVWSAGCSTGEELYTLASLIAERIPDREGWSIRLVGTDVDDVALERAREGVYGQWSLRATTDEERDRVFERVAAGFRVRDELRRDVCFGQHNLADPSAPLPLPLEFDLIFCRHVAIYFSRPALQTLWRNIDRALARGGIWIGSPSDPVPGAPFVTDVRSGLLLHRRAQPQALARPSLPIDADEITKRFRIPPRVAPRSSNRAAVVRPEPRAIAEHLTPTVAVRPEIEPPDLEHTLAAIRATADKGQLEQALSEVVALAERHALSTATHRLLGLLHEAAERLDEAAAAYQKVLYLEPQDVDSHLRLGLLLARRGDRHGAVRCLRNALVAGGRIPTGAGPRSVPESLTVRLLERLRGESRHE